MCQPAVLKGQPMTYNPVEQHPWMDGALCAQVGGDIFFVDDRAEMAAARRICSSCPVIAECLSYAIEKEPTQ